MGDYTRQQSTGGTRPTVAQLFTFMLSTFQGLSTLLFTGEHSLSTPSCLLYSPTMTLGLHCDLAGLTVSPMTNGLASVMGALQQVVTLCQTRIASLFGSTMHLLLLLATMTELILECLVTRRTLARVAFESTFVLTQPFPLVGPVVVLLATTVGENVGVMFPLSQQLATITPVLWQPFTIYILTHWTTPHILFLFAALVYVQILYPFGDTSQMHHLVTLHTVPC